MLCASLTMYKCDAVLRESDGEIGILLKVIITVILLKNEIQKKKHDFSCFFKNYVKGIMDNWN